MWNGRVFFEHTLIAWRWPVPAEWEQSADKTMLGAPWFAVGWQQVLSHTALLAHVLMLPACLCPASKTKCHVYNIFPLPTYQNPQSFRCLREESCRLADTVQWNAGTFPAGERGSPREGKKTPRRNGSAPGEAGRGTGGVPAGLRERAWSQGERWAEVAEGSIQNTRVLSSKSHRFLSRVNTVSGIPGWSSG